MYVFNKDTSLTSNLGADESPVSMWRMLTIWREKRYSWAAFKYCFLSKALQTYKRVKFFTRPLDCE